MDAIILIALRCSKQLSLTILISEQCKYQQDLVKKKEKTLTKKIKNKKIPTRQHEIYANT